MQDLEITWPDGIARFSVADSPIQVGRSSEASIPITDGSVSRRHLELLWDGAGWTVSDSSTHGTFDPIGVRLAPQWALSDDVTIRLGGVEGVQVQIHSVRSESEPDPAANANPAAGTQNRSPGAGVSGPPPPARSANGATSRRATPATPPPPPRPQEDRNSAPSGGLFADAGGNHSAAAGIGQRNGGPAGAGDDGDDPSGMHFGGDSLFADRPAGRANTSILGGGSSNPADRQGPRRGLLEPEAPASRVLDPEAFGSPPPPRPQSPKAETDRKPQPQAKAPGPAKAGRSGLLEQPRADQGGFPGPGPTGGHPAVNLDPNSTIISDSTLRLNVAGQDYSFLPGAEVTIGRDPSCLVQLDERHSLVSRKHIRITFNDGAWWLEDFSSKGTFVNNRPLRKPYKAEGAFIANLGDDDAGTPMRIITAGEHRVPGNRNVPAIVGLAAAALIPLIILAVLLSRGDSSSSEPDLVAAKQATVMLFGVDGGQGSGFMVSDDLILTNQHVAVLSAQMLVGVSRQADEPAQIEYATELVANHPFLDLAVLRISNRADMTPNGPEILTDPVGNIDLPAVAVGDSNDVTIGDRVFNTSFPGRLSITSVDDAGDLRLPSVVATSGEAANFAIWPGCSNPDFELFIPSDSPPGVACSAGGDLRNGVMLSSFFSSGQGASGSAIFHENQVVAVVYAGAADEDNATLSITSSVFSDWLQEIIDQNR